MMQDRYLRDLTVVNCVGEQRQRLATSSKLEIAVREEKLQSRIRTEYKLVFCGLGGFAVPAAKK